MQDLDSNKIQIVCVSNDADTFNNVIATNTNMNKHNICMLDNSVENIGIAKRYNAYINGNINKNSDFWVVFCHQDFGFNEDPIEKLRKLNKKNIYGVTGVKVYFSIKKSIKSIISQKIGFYPSIRVSLKALFDKDDTFFCFRKGKPVSGYIKRELLGQINQGQNNSAFEKNGKKIYSPQNVSSIDCCCLIVHSSLIAKHKLRFDENLNWHMYVEDFCINSKAQHKIKSQVVQFDCYHLGKGTFNSDFYAASHYIKEKYNLKSLKTSCIED